MFKEIFVLMLLGHILGDYYTQTDSVAQKRTNTSNGSSFMPCAIG